LNEKEKGKKYRLPTEAEWEYAARAESKTEWFFGDDLAALGQYAWFAENSQKTTHPVGEKKPNPWGLYDIYGNVWEWVADCYDEDKLWLKDGAVTDPTGPHESEVYGLIGGVRGHAIRRLLRGGGWGNDAQNCHSAIRGNQPPSERFYDLGFRMALSLD
jgi:formylglycine-generating enzyme required for sulfatase activity